MGWWPIQPDAGGGIDWDKAVERGGIVNSVPGTEHGLELVNGDGPADLIGNAKHRIAAMLIRGFDTKKLFTSFLVNDSVADIPYGNSQIKVILEETKRPN